MLRIRRLSDGDHPRPEQIMIVYEAHSEIRRVYLGYRIVPDADRVPDRNGVRAADGKATRWSSKRRISSSRSISGIRTATRRTSSSGII